MVGRVFRAPRLEDGIPALPRRSLPAQTCASDSVGGPFMADVQCITVWFTAIGFGDDWKRNG